MKKIKIVYTVYGEKYALMLLNGLKLAESNVEYHDYFVNEDAKQCLLKHGIPEYRIHDTYGENVYIDKIMNAMLYSKEKPDYLVIAADSSAIIKKECWLYDKIHEVEPLFDYYGNKQVYLQSPEFWNIFDYECTVPEFTKYKNGICAGLIIYNQVTQETIDLFWNTYKSLSSGDIKVNWYTYDEHSQARYNENTKVTEEQVLEYILNKCDDYHFDVNFEVFDQVPYCYFSKWSTARVLTNIFLEVFNWGSGNMIDEMIEEGKTKYQGEYYLDSSLVEEFKKVK